MTTGGRKFADSYFSLRSNSPTEVGKSDLPTLRCFADLQQRGGFQVAAIGDEQESLLFADALKDNSQTPPPEAAAFRIDFPRWRRRRSRRDRHIMDELAMGDRTQQVARRHRLSPARVSQLRREFHDDWQRFCEPQAAG